MTKQFVFVDASRIHLNKTNNAVSPPIVVTSGGNFEAPRAGCKVKINGPCEIIYDKKGVMYDGHGAHVVVITEAEIEIERGYTGVER